MKRVFQYTYYPSPFEQGQIRVVAASQDEANRIAKLIIRLNLCGNIKVNA